MSCGRGHALKWDTSLAGDDHRDYDPPACSLHWRAPAQVLRQCAARILHGVTVPSPDRHQVPKCHRTCVISTTFCQTWHDSCKILQLLRLDGESVSNLTHSTPNWRATSKLLTWGIVNGRQRNTTGGLDGSVRQLLTHL